MHAFSKLPQDILLRSPTETVYLPIVSAGTVCRGSRVALFVGSAVASLNPLRMSIITVERNPGENIAF
jgi:hypothetical protein